MLNFNRIGKKTGVIFLFIITVLIVLTVAVPGFIFVLPVMLTAVILMLFSSTRGEAQSAEAFCVPAEISSRGPPSRFL